MSTDPVCFAADRPLNVQIAEALGWTGCNSINGLWLGCPPDGVNFREVPGYGQTFCSTGPLIERYQILVGPEYDGTTGELVFLNKWGAKMGSDRTGETITYGATACEAVGNLILFVASKGELK